MRSSRNRLLTPIALALLLAAAVGLDIDGAAGPTISRGPYLQRGSPTSIIVRWRTDLPTNSQVRYGLDPSALAATSEDAAITTEHRIVLSGLTPDTRYYYSVGSATSVLAGGDATHTFRTTPTAGTSKPTRVWVIGDSGTANANAAAVRDAYQSFTGALGTDLWLMLGDNAYPDGTDAQYQAAVFDMYPAMLRQSVLWPTLGNHDGHSADSGTLAGVYYNTFSLPRSAEAGGLASGTEAYYSFDHANIHFICLDSFDTDRATTAPMLTWLRSDLMSTTQPWVVAFWHHPPYSKGSHDSDTEIELRQMRENALPILEDAGVDLVLAGHSHSYERSYLLDGHYGTSATLTSDMIKNAGDGRVDGAGAYWKTTADQAPHEGAVYAVAGSSGQVGGGALNHPAMFVSLNSLGSMVLDIDADRLDAQFIDATGAVLDSFTLVKGTPAAPTSVSATAVSSARIDLSWTDNSSSETSFVVQRATGAGAFADRAVLGAGVTSFSDSPLTPSTTYSYRVRAVNPGGPSGYSNTAAATTQSVLSVTIDDPAGSTATATSPFLRVRGTAASTSTVASVTWATDRGFAGGGTLADGIRDATSNARAFSADIPLVAGTNVVTITATDEAGAVATDVVTVTVSAFVYDLAEGATGPFFDLELALANPNASDAPVVIQYLKDDGSTVGQSLTLAPRSRQTILVDGLAGLANTAVSAVVTSVNALPLAVERTMTWDATGYGSHTEKATLGAHRTWYFAEGSEQAFFDTYLLLANPQGTANRATVQFLVEGGSLVSKVYDLLPTSRLNVFAGDVEEPPGTKILSGKAFGMVVTFDQPGVAERAMYFGATPFWNGGHESAGVNEPRTSWFFAEGATGPFFDTFLLLSNPNATDAAVTLTFLLDSGETSAETIVRSRTVPANTRLTVIVGGEDARLANAAMATQVSSNIPIVAERSMYWAAYPNWYEAHNSFGVTTAATKWVLGEGRAGGPSGYETYILLANPGAAPATVTVTYLREGGQPPIVRSHTVPPTSRLNVYANDAAVGLASGERFGVLIESTAPIVVERAMYSNTSSQPGVVWAAGTDAAATRIP